MATIRFLFDSGHGWLEVPLADLMASGYTPSRYSYYDDDGMVYLEEDSDMPGYMAAAGLGNDFQFDEVRLTWSAWIRDLHHCGADWRR
jgi:hypothetical protein